MRKFRPCLEVLENRLAPAIMGPLVATPGGTLGVSVTSSTPATRTAA